MSSSQPTKKQRQHDVRGSVLRLMEYSCWHMMGTVDAVYFQRLHMKCFLLFLSYSTDIAWPIQEAATKEDQDQKDQAQGQEDQEDQKSLMDRAHFQVDKLLHSLKQVHAPLMQEMLLQPICSELSTWLNSPIEMAMHAKNHDALARYVDVLAAFCTSRRDVLNMEIVGLECAYNVLEVMSLREMARRYGQLRQLERIVYSSDDTLLDVAASALLLLHQVN